MEKEPVNSSSLSGVSVSELVRWEREDHYSCVTLTVVSGSVLIAADNHPQSAATINLGDHFTASPRFKHAPPPAQRRAVAFDVAVKKASFVPLHLNSTPPLRQPRRRRAGMRFWTWKELLGCLQPPFIRRRSQSSHAEPFWLQSAPTPTPTHP